MTGVCHVSFFWSTSRPSSKVVIAFVFEAMMYSVSASGFSGFPSSRTPKPPANTTFPPCTIPSETPGTPSWLCPRSTNAPSSAMRAASSVFAFRPANVSRV